MDIVKGKMGRNISGQKFGHLTALRPTDMRNNGSVVWTFICDCGNQTDKPLNSVTSGKLQSCGCMRGKHNGLENDVTGYKFGRLTALYATDQKSGGHTVWRFRCDCGNEIEQRLVDVKRGNTQSCGCLRDEYFSNRKIDISGQQFGFLKAICPMDYTYRGCIVWKFRCICGNEIEKSASMVKSGHVKSCGCMRYSGLIHQK